MKYVSASRKRVNVSASFRVTSTRSTVGARAQTELDLGGLMVTARVKLAWSHEFGDQTTSTISAFQANPGLPFKVLSPKMGRDAAVGGVGVNIPLDTDVSVYSDYAIDARTHYTGQSVGAGLRINF